MVFGAFRDGVAQGGVVRTKEEPMNSKIIRTLSAAFLMSAAVIVASRLVSSMPAYAAAAPSIKLPADNKPLADAVIGAQADFKAMRFAEALAKAKTADGMSGKPAELTRIIHGM